MLRHTHFCVWRDLERCNGGSWSTIHLGSLANVQPESECSKLLTQWQTQTYKVNVILDWYTATETYAVCWRCQHSILISVSSWSAFHTWASKTFIDLIWFQRLFATRLYMLRQTASLSDVQKRKCETCFTASLETHPLWQNCSKDNCAVTQRMLHPRAYDLQHGPGLMFSLSSAHHLLRCLWKKATHLSNASSTCCWGGTP